MLANVLAVVDLCARHPKLCVHLIYTRHITPHFYELPCTVRMSVVQLLMCFQTRTVYLSVRSVVTCSMCVQNVIDAEAFLEGGDRDHTTSLLGDDFANNLRAQEDFEAQKHQLQVPHLQCHVGTMLPEYLISCQCPNPLCRLVGATECTRMSVHARLVTSLMYSAAVWRRVHTLCHRATKLCQKMLVETLVIGVVIQLLA